MQTLLLLLLGIAILLAILSYLRNKLLAEMQASTLLLLGSDRVGIFLYATIMLPGTILHELSHWLFSELLRVPTGKITIIPNLSQESGQSQNLGSVESAATDPIRSSIIGAAPLGVGILSLYILATFLKDLWGIAPWWQLVLIIYGLVVVGNSMIVSQSDRKSWGFAIIFIIFLGLLIWQIGLRPTEELLNSISSTLQILIRVIGLTVTLNFATIGVLVLIRLLIERVSHKKVMFSR